MKTILIAEGGAPNRHSLMRLLEDPYRLGFAADDAAALRLQSDPASAAIPAIAPLAHAMRGGAERGRSGLPRSSDRAERRERLVREDCEAP